MRHLLQSLIISIAVIATASPSFARDDHEDRDWDRDKKKELIMIVEALEERVTALEEENAELKSNLACISDESDGYNVYFDGCNVHVRNAVGQTDSKNDRGNLIIGYNEDHEGELNDRTGSHNLIIGSEHTYTSFGGLVAGFQNTISGEHASVSGGQGNTASGKESSVSGGEDNTASGVWSSISGGDFNTVSGSKSSVSGGAGNTASGDRSPASAAAPIIRPTVPAPASAVVGRILLALVLVPKS